MSKIVLALGGNALGNTPQEEKEITKKTAKLITYLAKEDHQIVIVHGNGPQVGMIYDSFAWTKTSKKPINMPFPECGALSQGYIGYHLQNAIANEFKSNNLNKQVVTLITQTIVDKNDPGFKSPSKPIGPFVTEAEKNEIVAKDSTIMMKLDPNFGWRRVVPSPKPINFVETKLIEKMSSCKDTIVICAGGGGVPVYLEDNKYIDVPAVIDKDFAAEKIAELISADQFVVLTAVDFVKINYGKPNEKNLTKVTIKEIDEYIKENQFSPGSMLPKIKACAMFAETGKSAYIGSLEKSFAVIREESGTKIVK